jgi:hypothetical protein
MIGLASAHYRAQLCRESRVEAACPATGHVTDGGVFKFEVQQVAGRNNGQRLSGNLVAYSSPSLWEGERGEGF